MEQNDKQTEKKKREEEEKQRKAEVFMIKFSNKHKWINSTRMIYLNGMFIKERERKTMQEDKNRTRRRI